MTRPALKITHIDWAINLRTKRITTEFSITPSRSDGTQRLILNGQQLKLVSLTLNERRLLPNQDYQLTISATGHIQVELALDTTHHSCLIVMTELPHHVKGNLFLKADELTLMPQGLNDLITSRTTIISDVRSHRNTIAPGLRQSLSQVQNTRKQITFATRHPESIAAYGLFAGQLHWDALSHRTQEGSSISLRVGVTHKRELAKTPITLVYMQMALNFLQRFYNLDYQEHEWTLIALEPRLRPMIADLNSSLVAHTDVLASLTATPWQGITAHSPSYAGVAKNIATIAVRRILKTTHGALVILQPALVAALADVLAHEFVKTILPPCYNRHQPRATSTSAFSVVEHIHDSMSQEQFGRLIQRCIEQTYECTVEDFEMLARSFIEGEQGIFYAKYQKLCLMLKASHIRSLPELFSALENDNTIQNKAKAMQAIALHLMRQCYYGQLDAQSNDLMRLCRYLKLYLTPQSEARDACELLNFPSQFDLYDAITSPSMNRVARAHDAFMASVSTLLTTDLLAQYQFLFQSYQHNQVVNHFDLDTMLDCELMHLLLRLLGASSYRASAKITDRCLQHFHDAHHLPMQLFALNALFNASLPEYPSTTEQQQWWQRCDNAGKSALQTYLRIYRKTNGRLLQAFAILSQGNSAYIVQDIKAIVVSEYFNFRDAAHIRNLIVAFAETNFRCHQYYLSAYELLFQVACTLDAEYQQPHLAIEVITPLIEAMSWLDQNRKQVAQRQIQKLHAISESPLLREFIEAHSCLQNSETLDEVPALTVRFDQMRVHQTAPMPQSSIGTALTVQKLK